MQMKYQIIGMWLLGAVTLLGHRSFGAETSVANAGKPVLLVLSVARTTPEREREREFVAELELTLDGWRVVHLDDVSAPQLMDFASQSLERRLASIRALSRRDNAVATIWLEAGKRGVTLLHLVSLSMGRSLVRIVEVAEDPGNEVTLAMAVDELVNQTWLFDARKGVPATTDTGATAADTENAKKCPERSPCVAPPPSPFSRALVASGIARAGVAGAEGPRWTLGGGVGLEVQLTQRIFISGGFNAMGGPFESSSIQKIRRLALEPSLSVHLLHPLGRISFGGAIGVAVPWQETAITLPGTGTHLYHDWNVRTSMVFSVRIHLLDKLALYLSPDVGFWADKKRYYTESTHRSIVRNPRVDIGLNLGIIIKN